MAYTYTLTSNPQSRFQISGNTILVNNSLIVAGNYPVTVRANDGGGSIIDQVFVLVASATGGAAASFNFSVPSNSQYIGTGM